MWGKQGSFIPAKLACFHSKRTALVYCLQHNDSDTFPGQQGRRLGAAQSSICRGSVVVGSRLSPVSAQLQSCEQQKTPPGEERGTGPEGLGVDALEEGEAAFAFLSHVAQAMTMPCRVINPSRNRSLTNYPALAKIAGCWVWVLKWFFCFYCNLNANLLWRYAVTRPYSRSSILLVVALAKNGTKRSLFTWDQINVCHTSCCRITESQTGWGQKGPLEAIWPNSHAQDVDTQTGSHGHRNQNPFADTSSKTNSWHVLWVTSSSPHAGRAEVPVPPCRRESATSVSLISNGCLAWVRVRCFTWNHEFPEPWRRWTYIVSYALSEKAAEYLRQCSARPRNI